MKTNKWFYIPIALFSINLLIRLMDQAKMLFYFPFGITNDSPSYMGKLFFLMKYGYNAYIPDWFNGFILFRHYPPGWFFFASPLYYIFNDVKIATYISLIMLYIIGFIVIWFFGKSQRISSIKRIAFYLFLFANPIAIGNFIRLTRVTELFAFVLFITLTAMLIHYKDKRINKKFLWFIPLYAIFIISHHAVVTLFHLFLLPFIFFLIKNNKEKIVIAVSGLIGILLSAFWWFPFITANLAEKAIYSGSFLNRLIEITGVWLLTNIAGLFIILFLLGSFYFYYKSDKNIILFIPILIISTLFLFRILIFIPLFNAILPDIYLISFLFFGLYFFFKLDFKIFSKELRRIIFISIIILSIVTVFISLFHTPRYTLPTESAKTTIELLDHVKGNLMIMRAPDFSNVNMIVYATIYKGIKSPYGAHTWGQVPNSYLDIVRKDVNNYLNNNDCNSIKLSFREINTEEFIAYEKDCTVLSSCMNLIKEKDNVCLYKL